MPPRAIGSVDCSTVHGDEFSGRRPSNLCLVGHTTAPIWRGKGTSMRELLVGRQWRANSALVREDAVDAVRAMKADGSCLLSTIGSISPSRSLLRAGLVDRFRAVTLPVITGATGGERIYDGYPDVALEMLDNRTFDGRIQLVEYRPHVLAHAPLDPAA